MKLIYLSKSPDSIYMDEQLSELAERYSETIEIKRVVDNCTKNDKAFDKVGRLEVDDLRRWIGESSASSDRQRIILVCGPESCVF